MALVLLDRVRETTLTSGTGNITLAGAVAGYQSFAAIGDLNDTYYTIYDPTANDWEVGIGTYLLLTNELTRTTVLSSSNGGALVPFAAGSKDVFVTYPAEKAIYEEVNGDTIINAGPITIYGPGVTPPIAPFSDTLGRFYGNQPTFQQVYVQNLNDDAEASSDLVAYNDLGDGNTYFVDVGISSSNYSSAMYPIFTPNSSYVFNDGGELIIGSGSVHDVILFAGGVDTTDEAVRIDATTKDVAFTNDVNVTGAVNVGDALDVTGAATFGNTVSLNQNPSTPLEAATKQYVDNQVTAGIHIHDPVLVETGFNLTAAYAQGGTTFDITDITGGNTVTTSVSHGLSVNDQIWLYSTAGNGLSINTAYFVYSTPAANQLTLSLAFGGVQLSGLTNATGLTYNTRANSGVGATLTNTGSILPLQIDLVNLSVGDRVMVRVQTNAYENGVYEVTNDGSSVAWVLTRATDSDRVNPADPNGVGTGDYYFTQAGNINAGNSNVLTTEPNTMIIGYTPLTYTQFSGGVSYIGGTNIDVTGQVISLIGAVAAINGGTGVDTVSTGDLLYGDSIGVWGKLNVGAPYQSLVVNGAGTQIEWNAVALSETGAVSGALPAVHGGTGINTYAVGDIIYSDATDSLEVLAGNTSTTKKFLNQTGTGSASAAPLWSEIANTDVSGLGTMSTQSANSVAITGGAINNTTVGATTPTTGKFTSLGLTGSVSGTTTFQAAATTTPTTYTLPAADGASSNFLATNGSGGLFWNNTAPFASVAQTIVTTAISANATYYPTFVSATSGDLSIGVDAGLTYNPFSNTLNTATLGATGNLNFTGTGNRITGDFSNATVADRVLFQTSTVDGNTIVGLLPNGSSTVSALNAYSTSNPTNSSYAQIAAFSTENRFNSDKHGTGTYLPMTFYTGGNERMRIDTAGIAGYGVTPSPWGTTFKAIQFGTGGSISARNAGIPTYVALGGNFYNSGTLVANYIEDGEASSYYQIEGGHYWRTAVSGLAGNTISWTEAMVLDASSQLGIGPNAATPRQRITLGNTTSTSTATPESIDMGGTYSSAAGLNLKLKLWNDGTNFYGLGVSGGQLDYSSNGKHVWYHNNAGVANKKMELDTSGFLYNAANGNTGQGVVPGLLTYILNADRNLNGVSTAAQNPFGVATSTLQPGRYRYKTNIGLIKNTGTGTIGFSLGGGATLAFHWSTSLTRLGATWATAVNAGSGTISSTSPTVNQVLTGATVAVSQNNVTMEGFFDVSVAGTVTFNITFSANPGTATAGSYRAARGSYVEVWPVSATGADTNIGGWA
jgi:hypothetical protein